MSISRAVALFALVIGAPACQVDGTVGRDLPSFGPGHLELAWSQTIGGNEPVSMYDVAIDPSGDVVLVGNAKGDVDFTAAPATVPPEVIPPEAGGLPTTGFVTKRAGGSGAHVWGAAIETGLSVEVFRVAVDASSNVYAAGTVVRTFGVGEVPATQDMFVAKYDASGELVWKQTLGDASLAEAHGLAITAGGDVIVSGLFRGTVDFGDGPVTSVDTYPGPDFRLVGDAFLARIDSDGAWQWGRVFAAAGEQIVTGLAIDGDGAIVATGHSFDGAAAFGGDVITPASGHGVVVASFAANGDARWSRPLAPVSGGSIWTASVQTDLGGDVHVLAYERTGDAFSVGLQELDEDGVTVASSSAPDPVYSSLAMSPDGLVISTGSLGEVSARIDVLDSTGVALGAAEFTALQPGNSGPWFQFDAGATNGTQIAIAGTFNYGVDLGLGMQWAHGSGPFDDTSYTMNGRDGLVALLEWVTD